MSETQAEVLEIEDDIDFDDIQDTGGDILKEDAPKPDKAAEREAKEAAKLERDRIRFAMKAAKEEERERNREEKAENKEKTKLEKAAGLFGGTDAATLRAQIIRYRNHTSFGPYLKSQGFTKNLEDKVIYKMEAKQLKDLKDRIKFTLANKNSGKFYKTGAVLALKAVEPVGERLGLKIGGVGPGGQGGLADICNQNPEFHDLLDEIFMEYNLFNMVGPEKRLLLLVIQSAFVVHGTRVKIESLSDEQRSKVFTAMGIASANANSNSNLSTNPLNAAAQPQLPTNDTQAPNGKVEMKFENPQIINVKY